MIPRLSGRARQSHATPAADASEASLPSRQETERIVRQFFRLIERFEADTLRAPETKASRRRKAVASQRLANLPQVHP